MARSALGPGDLRLHVSLLRPGLVHVPSLRPSPHRVVPMQQIKLQDIKSKSPTELLAFAEELEVENASTLRKQELMFAILQTAGRPRTSTSSARASSRCCRTVSATCARPTPTISPGPDDIYVSPSQIRRFGLQHRRHGRRRDPLPEGRRALLRPAEGQPDQLRGAGKGPPQGQFRQSDAALSEPAAADGGRGSDQEGLFGANHGRGGAARQRPARPHRGAAAHRQDGAAAEHRPVHHRATTRNATSSSCSSTSGRKRSRTCSAR